MPTGSFSRLILGDGLAGTDNSDGSITIDATAGDPAADTAVWMPLFDSDGSVVLDGDGGVIPTLIPIG